MMAKQTAKSHLKTTYKVLRAVKIHGLNFDSKKSLFDFRLVSKASVRPSTGYLFTPQAHRGANRGRNPQREITNTLRKSSVPVSKIMEAREQRGFASRADDAIARGCGPRHRWTRSSKKVNRRLLGPTQGQILCPGTQITATQNPANVRRGLGTNSLRRHMTRDRVHTSSRAWRSKFRSVQSPRFRPVTIGTGVDRKPS
jgi:hypothetical protein